MEKEVDTGETKGLERKFDKLGRIVIPIEFRNALGLKEKDSVEIFLIQDGIFIRKV